MGILLVMRPSFRIKTQFKTDDDGHLKYFHQSREITCVFKLKLNKQCVNCVAS